MATRRQLAAGLSRAYRDLGERDLRIGELERAADPESATYLLDELRTARVNRAEDRARIADLELTVASMARQLEAGTAVAVAGSCRRCPEVDRQLEALQRVLTDYQDADEARDRAAMGAAPATFRPWRAGSRVT